MAHANLHLDYFGHPKTRRLVGLLMRGAEVLPLKLWCYCGKYHCEDGRLSGYGEQEIEAVVEWWGKPGECVRAMMTVGFLGKDEQGFFVHDWLEHQGHIPALRERNKNNALSRWQKVRGECQTDASGIQDQCSLPPKPPKPSNPSNPSNPENQGVAGKPPRSRRDAKKPKEPKPPAYPPGTMKAFTDAFCERWEKTYSRKPPKFEPIDGKKADEILRSIFGTGGDLAEALRVLDRYFADRDDFYKGHKLPKLAADLERFIVEHQGDDYTREALRMIRGDKHGS